MPIERDTHLNFSLAEVFKKYLKKVNILLQKLNDELPQFPQNDLQDFLLILTIVDYQLMNQKRNRDIVIELAERLLSKYNIGAWSFDKGYWL